MKSWRFWYRPLNSKKVDNHRTITQNRKAFHDYNILERVEAGVVLTGAEIKSIRAGRVNIAGAYVKPDKGELWLVNCHVAQYQTPPSTTTTPSGRGNCCFIRSR